MPKTDVKPFTKLLESKLPKDRWPEIQERMDRIEEAHTLEQLRKARQFSQNELAQVLKVTQANVSKIEKRTDMYLSTMRNFIEAMGGHLDIIASFPEGKYVITQFNRLGLNEDVPAQNK